MNIFSVIGLCELTVYCSATSNLKTTSTAAPRQTSQVPEPVKSSDANVVKIANAVKDDLTAKLKKDRVQVTKYEVLNYKYRISGCCTQFFFIKIRVNDDPKIGFVQAQIHTYRSEPAMLDGYIKNQSATDPLVQQLSG